MNRLYSQFCCFLINGSFDRLYKCRSLRVVALASLLISAAVAFSEQTSLQGHYQDSSIFDGDAVPDEQTMISPTSVATSGRASDLGPAMGLSWPMNQPYSCPELRTSLEESTKSAALKLKVFCNDASRKMEEAGFPKCRPNLCPVSSQGSSVKKDLGNLEASFSYSPDYRGVFVSLTYNFPQGEPSGSSLVCFDPMLTAFEVVQTEVDSWSFSKFAAICVHGKVTE